MNAGKEAVDYHKSQIKLHFDAIAAKYDHWKRKNDYYYSQLKDFYRKNIPPGASVIEFGCATGEILASCRPKKGVGIDISDNIIILAKAKYPQYEFRVADVECFTSCEKFDYCIMSDLLDHLYDIPKAIQSAYDLLNPRGRLLINTINPLYNPLFELLERLHFKMPEGPHCFIPNRFVEFYCQMKGFETLSKGAMLFIPQKIFFISGILNKIIPRIPILNKLCWVQTLIVRKGAWLKKELSYSVIMPVYNEEKNIEECINRIPKPQRDYEILAIDDGSQDKTAQILKGLTEKIQNLKVLRLPENMGKAHAIEEGIRNAQKKVIVILDADMSVAPEDIPLFIEPLERGLADFVNGTRLVYNMEKNAMAQIKRIANFSLAILFSMINKLHLSDTLCGTKAFFKRDFQDIKIHAERWGDLLLLERARVKGLKIKEVPVRYYARKFGVSKMRFFSDGMRFLGYSLSTALRRT